MCKFSERLMKDVKYGLGYKYAPETFKVEYKGEDITDFLDSKLVTSQHYIKGEFKNVEDAIIRGFRKYSKFSQKNKLVKLHLCLSDGSAICSNLGIRNRFDNLESRLEDYKVLKEYFNSACTEKYSLDGTYNCAEKSEVRLFEGLSIKGIMYI